MKILGLTFCPYGTEKSVVLRGLTLIDNKGTKLSSVQKHVVQKNKQHKPEARDKQLEQKKTPEFFIRVYFCFHLENEKFTGDLSLFRCCRGKVSLKSSFLTLGPNN